MATATRSPLTDQAEKLGRLAQYLGDGRLLEPVLRLAQSDEVWSGPIHDAFLGWMQHGLDLFVRNQLAEGVRLVAKSLADRAAAIEQAQAAMDAGQIGVVGPAAPTPLNYVPGTPPPYGDIGGGPNSQFKTDGMRKLSQLLGQTADGAVIEFNKKLRDALVPPPMPPPPPGSPPPISPLPPDAEAVVGNPNTAGPGNIYLAIAQELRNAAADIDKRADALRILEEPMETATLGLGGFLKTARDAIDRANEAAAAAGTAGAEGAAASEETAPTPQGATEEPPLTPEQVEEIRKEGTALAREALKKDVLNNPQELEKIAKQLDEHKGKPGHEAFCAAFVEKFDAKRMVAVPRTLQAWQNGWEVTAHDERPPQKNLPLGKGSPKGTDQEVEDVLYAFSATIASASHHEGSPKLEEELDELTRAEHPLDPVALSWLLSNEDADFDTDFLLGAFDVCVKNVIIWESGQKGQGFKGYDARMDPPPRLTDGERYPDPKVAALNAISRNPEAAAALNTAEFEPFEMRIGGGGGEVDINNLVDLVYQGTYPSPDDGAAVTRFLQTSYDAMLAGDDGGAAARNLVDQMVKGAGTVDLPDRARRGLATIMVNHTAHLAALAAGADLDRGTEFEIPHDLAQEEVTAAIQEVAHDAPALTTLMVGLGKWVANTYDDFAIMLTDKNFDLFTTSEHFSKENEKIGEVFCQVARSAKAAGIEAREEALAILGSFRLGVDIVFDVAKKVPVVGDISGAYDKIPGGLSGKAQDHIKDNIAGWLSGINEEEERSKSKEKTEGALTSLDHILVDKSMAALGKHPLLLRELMSEDIRARWPKFMLNDPAVQVPRDLPPDPAYLVPYLKPEYVAPDGSVRFPDPGEDEYREYQAWCNQDWNRVAERASTMTEKARNRMRQCMTDVGWIESA